MSRHNLFFTPEQETDDFCGVLQTVQEYISAQHSDLLSDGNAAEAKAQIKRYIAKFKQDSRVAVRGMTQAQLVDVLYTEMAEYSFLTKCIFGDGIEEIDINSWRDIEIQYAGGRCEKLTEHFDSPEHCINVLRRMLHVSGAILDEQSPVVVGTLAENIRIAVMKHPVVDASVGAAASIRIVNPHNLAKEDFIGGATSSGKTTVAGWLLSTIPDSKRVFTIENGSRELSLLRETDGRVTNSVVHTQTSLKKA